MPPCREHLTIGRTDKLRQVGQRDTSAVWKAVRVALQNTE
jgi:hypothetical protein